MGKLVLNTFLLTFASCAVIAYDVSTHGSLESSHTGRYLKQAGLLIYVKPYYSIIEEQTLILFKWCQRNFPHKEYEVFKNRTVDLSKNVGSQILYLSKESFTIAKSISVNSYEWVASRIPPDFSDQTFKFLSKSSEVIYHYSKKTFDYLANSVHKTQKWLAENMTKEKLTWENLNKLLHDVAQTLKTNYSHFSRWVARKVECLMSA